MKIFGIILVVVGVLLLATPVFLFLAKDENGKMPAALQVKAENDVTMSLFPLLGIVSIATGGALIVAQYVTRKQSR